MTLKNLGNVSEAFTTFLFGYKKATIQKQETRTDFVVEAVMLLLQMQGMLQNVLRINQKQGFHLKVATFLSNIWTEPVRMSRLRLLL